MEGRVPFEIIPAVDIMAGSAVRLVGGDYSSAKVYWKDAGDAASYWQDQGAARLHVVDLDGALKGETVNGRALEAIRSRFFGLLDFGGGIRDVEGAGRAFDAGADFVDLGTALLKDAGFAGGLVKGYPGRIIASVDLKGGRAMAEGWTEGLDLRVEALAGILKVLGIGTAIVTDVSKDGGLKGVSVGILEPFIAQGLCAIASGGTGTLDDIRKAARKAASMELIHEKGGRALGLIVGKALYEKAFSLGEAKEAASSAAAEARGRSLEGLRP